MKQTVRLHNILLPIWLLWIFPQVWLIVIPGNLIIDCLVLFLCLLALRCREKGAVMKKLWWRFWLLGFAADAVGVLWMVLGWLLYLPLGSGWENTVGHISHNPFAHPAAFLWTLIAVGLAGVCIFAFDLRAMHSCIGLTNREKRRIALTMAVITAPWLFFIPMY